ncbi:MAG: hypothetical protein KGZ25_07185, partial [Planctomycetes bacterium]|nr:hypothetical protein [Planctomycetota bacterium]
PEGIKVWKDDRKSEELTARQWDLSSEREAFRTLAASDLYVEGCRLGRAGEIVLKYKDTGLSFQDKVRVTVVKVEITQAPDYLFANARYATPVRFEIGAGSDTVTFEEIEPLIQNGSVKVRFYAADGDGSQEEPLRFTTNNLAPTSSDPTGRICRVYPEAEKELKILGDGDSGQKNCYEVYVPSSRFRAIGEIAKDGDDKHTTKWAHFEVVVGMGCGDGAAVRFVTESAPSEHDQTYDEHGRLLNAGPRIAAFADKAAPAADIALGEQPHTPLPEDALFNCNAIKRTEAVKRFEYRYWESFPSVGTRWVVKETSTGEEPECERPCWVYPEWPQYSEQAFSAHTNEAGQVIIDSTNEVDSGNIFANTIHIDEEHIAESELVQLPGNIGWGKGYHPIICSKNIGRREGARLCISYGAKEPEHFPDGLLSDGELPMDLSKNKGKIKLNYVDGGAHLRMKIDQNKEPQTSVAELMEAGAIVTSFFWETGVPQLLTLAAALCEKMDKSVDTEHDGGGQVSLGTYYSRLSPRGRGFSEIGKTIYVKKTDGAPNYDKNIKSLHVYKSFDVRVGDEAQIYADFAVELQLRANGWTSWRETPARGHAFARLKESENMQVWYTLQQD